MTLRKIIHFHGQLSGDGVGLSLKSKVQSRKSCSDRGFKRQSFAVYPQALLILLLSGTGFYQWVPSDYTLLFIVGFANNKKFILLSWADKIQWSDLTTEPHTILLNYFN